MVFEMDENANIATNSIGADQTNKKAAGSNEEPEEAVPELLKSTKMILHETLDIFGGEGGSSKVLTVLLVDNEKGRIVGGTNMKGGKISAREGERLRRIATAVANASSDTERRVGHIKIQYDSDALVVIPQDRFLIAAVINKN